MRSAAYLVEDLTRACTYLPEAKALVAEAVKAKRLSAKEGQSLVSRLYEEALQVQKLRERLERLNDALTSVLPPEPKSEGHATSSAGAPGDEAPPDAAPPKKKAVGHG